jgi:hypothetical protein
VQSHRQKGNQCPDLVYEDQFLVIGIDFQDLLEGAEEAIEKEGMMMLDQEHNISLITINMGATLTIHNHPMGTILEDIVQQDEVVQVESDLMRNILETHGMPMIIPMAEAHHLNSITLEVTTTGDTILTIQEGNLDMTEE